MSATGVPGDTVNLGAPLTATTMATTGGDTSHVTSGPPPSTSETPTLDDKRSSGGNTLAGEEIDEKAGSSNGKAKRLTSNSNEDVVAELEPHHVSVSRGKHEFAALDRKYSSISQHSNELARHTTRQSLQSTFSRSDRVTSRHTADEAEKQKEEEGEFHLADVLRSNRENQDEAGIKRKAVGVVWDDLEVIGAGGMKINIRNFSSAIMEQFMMPVIKLLGAVGHNPFAPKPKTIIHPTSGLLKPGEMCLVLGRPEAGCTTFLKTITNQRAGFMEVKGDVEYAGVPWKEMRKLYGGEVVYNQEDDDHLPTLTVAQTIRFALAMKTPRKKIPGVTPAQFQEDLLDLLLSMLNIKHTANTIVGNAFVRGVSGGERKRVSIAEMFCSGAAVCSWDNSTRGLDASTALDYAKSLRLLTDIMNQTTFVSLYQAGEGIYDQFDKVLVLNEGHVAYFGPAKEARQYMIGLGYRDLPRQTTADYLSGCTDVNERRFADGRDASNVPATPEEMGAAYRESAICARVTQEKEEYAALIKRDATAQEDFRQAVMEQKHKGVGKKSPFTVSFATQIWILFKRQIRLKFQDTFGISTGYATSIIIALIVGSVYFRLPQSASGAFTRGGLLFLGLLFNALTSFSELPSQMLGRSVLYRQNEYRFYRPAAFAVASVMADIPYNASLIFIFSIILYFMGGLYSSGGAFFIFFLFIFLTFMVMSSFFRTLGVATSDYNVAARLASVLISFMVTYTGYMIPVQEMKRWLFWIFYLNPLSYGYEAIFANEFSRITLVCDDSYTIPRNIPSLGVTGYPDTLGPNQMCSISGSTPGDPNVSGSAYMAVGYEYYKSHIWRNFGILCGFFVFFMFLQMFFIEYLEQGAKHFSVNVFKKEDKDLKAKNERLADRREAFRAGELDQDLSELKMRPEPFTWEGLNYTVPVPGGQRQLLNDIYGYVKPGTLTALMGASGAGKTTLLDVLAARKNIGVVGGDILMNGRPIGTDFQRGCAYAEQQDTHEWTTTVREALQYSAYLRQPEHVAKQEKDDYVEDILELLELQDLADAMIGFPGYGLSVEARKRVTIGVELAAKPELLLFLDEPTSGLDGQSAYNIVRFLKKLCAAGQKILCTIHQPNALLFQSFDRLLLLQRGGECVYFGDIGPDSRVLIDYLERNGAPVPSNVNPAEYMLEVIGAGSRKRIGGDWGEKWRNSPEFSNVKQEIIALKEQALAQPVEENANASEYATSFMFQLKIVLERTNAALWRNADYQWTRLFAHLAIGLVVTLTFLQLDNSLRSLQYRVFTIFFATVLPALILAQIEPQYIMSRMTFNREASSKMYSSTVFALTQLLAEMPYSLICSVCFFLLIYYGVGFPYASSRAGYFFLMILVTEVYAVTLGQAVAALSPTILIAALFNPFLLVLFSLFCGVTAPPPTLPYFWRSWMYPLDPFTRLISGLVSTGLQGVEVVCRDDEYNVFPAPSGQTCSDYAGAYATAVGGYLNNPDSTGDCQFCQYRTGEAFFTPLEIEFGTRWRDFGIFICYVVFNILVLLVAARFLKWQRR
ncbi:ATP-binding cassette transporter [Cryptococcus wingfieldii CBS 7118]|uniref:ATP-binding cassette transporter n=1 Tax=Cryptococcus wingfieldii CBS 7118 TaxID=1295528 RepID=A0A1E3IBU4_9TREE|nr:ATP-binding cassette transporter [Cryptococcus wingfieldii CBS 7118]ODN86072.1 ATP-binding cassette transporter [Cryptococcus wingfieldii CBS 7118]